MSGIQAPRMVKPRSSSGRAKPGYVFKMLRIRGFEPFDPIGTAYHEERIRHADGSWTDVALRTDLRGVPIQRQVVDGQLQDVTWWQGPVSSGPCQRCSIAGGAREIVRTTRPAQVRRDNRVPVVKSAGVWHPSCLRVRLSKLGRFGHDQRQMASKVTVSK